MARDDAEDLSAEAPSTVSAPGVLDNDELNGAELVTLAVGTRLGGSVTLSLDGSFVYTPPADPGHLPRVDDFTYTLRGPDGEASATVALTLYGSPLAVDDHYGTLEDTALLVAAPGVMENDDAKGATIETFDATSTAGGSVLIEPSGALSYTPPAGFVGADSFFYTLTDVAGSATATVNVQVGREPLAADDQYLGSKGELLTPERSVLDNDALGAPDAAIVSFGGGSLGGSVTDHPVGTTVEVTGSSLTLAADGLFIFEPEPGLVGPFEFTYQIENASGSSEATVVIDVHEAPFAVDDAFDMLAGATLEVPADDPESLLYDDVGTPAPVITSYGGGTLGGSVSDHVAGASVVTGGGTLTVNADGSITFATTAGASGEVRFDYHIESAAGNDEGSVTITVAHPPEITSPNVLTLRAGASTNLPFELTATGAPEPTVSVDGVLPSGVLFEDGSLTGTPAADAGGVYALTVTAENGVEPDAIQTLTVTVQTEAVLLGATDATFTVGTEGTYTPTTIGGVPAPTLTLVGTLPLGLTFDPVTGSISGTPDDATGGTYAVDIIASNGIGADAPLEVFLEVLEAPEITSDDAVTFTVGEPASFEVTTTGNPDRTVSLSGTLPSGVAFDGSTGLLEGTPAAGSGGEYELALEASNGVLPDALQELTVTVNEAPSLSGAATATFTVGSAGIYIATRGGFPIPTLSLTGALPAGVSFDAETGTISGTPEPGMSGSYPLTLSADNGIGAAATLLVTLGVQDVSTITSPDAVTFEVGTEGAFTVTAVGTPPPTLSVTGTLPTGVSFAPATGVLSGTPALGTGGTYDLTIGADNGVGVAGSQSFTLTVNEAPSLLGDATTTFVVGQNDSYSVTRGGFPLPTLSLSGSLPSGLSFDATSGSISGTPAAGTGGSYPVSIGAENGIGSAASLSVTVTVNEGPAITSANATTFTVGSAGSFTVTRTGTPTATLSVTGSLPSGVTFTPGTGVLAGTPAAGTGGVYTLTVGANNGVGSAASQTFTLTVNQAPSLSGAPSATFVVGTPNTYTATRSGFPQPTLSLSGSLPSGLTFGAATGTISGTAASGTGGSYSVTISADNGVGAIANLPVAITVNEGSAITSANATTFTVGSAGTFTVTSTGTPAATLSVSGSLPSGVTFAAATGVLSGTPGAGTGGAYPLTLSANNGVGSAASQSFTLTVNQAPAISGAATATFVVGTASSYTPTATGFPAPTFGLSGSLPSGLSFSTSTGVISGTAASGTGGSYPVTISAGNGVGSNDTLAVTITVNQGTAITSANATTFTVGSAGSFTVTATGTPAPTFGVTGSLPTGVTLNTSSGVLSGTPGAGTGGTYSLTFSASNGVGTAASQSFTLTVNQAPSLSGPATAIFGIGTNGSYTPTVSGFPAPAFDLTGSLPSGVSFNTSSGTISGTAASGSAGSYPVTITASNGVGSDASLAVTFDVVQVPSITSANATTFTVGSAGTFTVTATASPAPTFGVTGTLPAGVTLNTSSGVLSGTPGAGTGGTYSLTLSADNGFGSPASQSFTLTVNQAPAISGSATATFVVGAANTYTPTATGFPAPTFALTGSLPSGLSFSTTTGVISGTAASGTGGSYPLTISAGNGVGSDDSLAVTLTVNQGTAITSANATTFTVGSAGSFTVTATGTPAPTYGVTGTLPSGVTLNTSSGLLSGTPGAGTGGTYSLTLSADNGVGTAASQSFTLTVNQAPAISGAPPSPADSGVPYSHSFTLSGFPAPTTAVFSGTLPTGLSLSSAGVLSGTPTVAGTFPAITVRATNTASTADITFTIVVIDPTPPPSATGESFAVTGNIPIDVPVGSSVLNNDTLNTATITGFGPSLALASTTAPGGTLTTTAGGSVTLASNGSFSYDPPAGTTGADSFAYTITNVAGSATAQVSFTISNRVWFVNASASGGGNGKFTSPFLDLPSVTSTASGDVIYALRSATPYSAKTLSSGQRLLGQGVTVSTTHLGFSLAPFARASLFGTAGTNSSLRRLVLGTSSYVRGFDVSALSGVEALSGSSITGVDISGMAVTASNAVAVNFQSFNGAVSLTSVTATGGSIPIFLLSTTGSFTVTGDGSGAKNGSGGTIQSSSSSAISLQTTQNVTLRSMNLQNITTQAVFGTNVVNLTLQGMQFSTIGTALDFDENVTGNNNLSGTVSITNSSFSNATARFLALLNFSGTLTSFTFDNNTLSTNPSGAFEMLIFDAARAETVSIKNNTFTNTASTVSNAAIQVFLGRTSLATSTPFAFVDVQNNTISGSNGTGIRLRVQDSNGTLRAKVLNNSVTGMTSSGFTQGIRIEAGSTTGDSTVCAQIAGNTSVFTMGGLDPSSTPNAAIGVRRQTGSGGTNDVFGIVGLPAGSSTCPVTGTATCAATPAVESFIGAQNPGSPGSAANGSLGGYLVSALSGFSSCTLP